MDLLDLKYLISFQQCNIKDVTPEITKWKRLYSALASVQNFDKCSNKILRFIQIVLNPARFTDNQIFETKRKAINECLSYVGYELQSNGRFRSLLLQKLLVKPNNVQMTF